MTKTEAIDILKKHIDCMKCDDTVCLKFKRCTECPFSDSLKFYKSTFVSELINLLEGNESDIVGEMSM